MNARNATWSTVFDRSLVVRDGRVRCPRRAEADVETCAPCPYLLAIEGDEMRVVCAWPYELGRRTRRELALGRRWSRSPNGRPARPRR